MFNFEKMENACLTLNMNTSCMSLQTTVKKGTRYKCAPAGGDGLCAIFERKSDGQSKMYYVHKDYLGSITMLTNEDGTVAERLSFDPCGRRRNAYDWIYAGVII